MKKLSALLLAAIMCLTLTACGGNSKNPLYLYPTDDDIPAINIKKLPDILEVVELTTDNWKDYIKVYSYSLETVEKDAFGEVINTKTTTYVQLGAGNERYHCFEDVAIELKDKTTGELTIYQFLHGGTNKIPEDFNLDNYDCTRIQGKLCFVDLPEEVFFTGNRQNVKLFNLAINSAAYYTLSVNGGTNSVDSPLSTYLD